MSLESLKRVLLKTKAHAREMRKSNLESRLNPKPKEEMPVLDVADEEMPALEVPDEADAKASSKADRAKEIESIKKLLARV